MSRLGLKSKGRFNISINSSTSNNNYKIVSSLTSKYFALFGHEKIYIFHSYSKNLTKEINYKAEYLLFDLEDKNIIVSDSYELKKYALFSDESKTFLSDDKKSNNISSLTYSSNYRFIFVLNNSKMLSIDIFSLKIKQISVKQLNSCSIDYIYVNSNTQQLISSSFDCNICIFSIDSSSKLTFIRKSFVQQCRIRQLMLLGDTLALTKNTINSLKPQIILLNPQNLSLMGVATQNSTQILINLVRVNNYILSYAVNDNLIEIYKDNLRNKPSSVRINSQIIGSVFSKYSNQINIVTFDQNQESINLETFALTYNCSFIKNQTNTETLQQNCSCQKGKSFQRSQLACKTLSCQISQCKCPYQQKFNPFSLQCEKDCSQVFNSLEVASFGIDNSCICNKPFIWNKQLSDCSDIDCSFIENAVNSLEYRPSCKCINNYEWNDINITCILRQKSNSVSEVSSSNVLGIVLGVLFLVLLLAISGVIYYYKKYKKSPEDQPKNYQYPPRSTDRNFGQTPRPIQSQVVLRDGYFNSQIPMYTLKSNRRD